MTFLFQNCHRQSAGVQAAPCWSRRSIKYTLVNFCQLFGNHEPNISAWLWIDTRIVGKLNNRPPQKVHLVFSFARWQNVLDNELGWVVIISNYPPHWAGVIRWADLDSQHSVSSIIMSKTGVDFLLNISKQKRSFEQKN